MAILPREEMLPIQAVELVLKQVGAQMHLGPFVVDQMRVEERVDHITQSLAYSVKTFVQTQHIANDYYTHDEEFPTSWWQHWKRDHHGRIARWIKRRRPVQTKKVTLRVDVESMAAFPDSSIIVDPSLGRPMLWQVVERSVIR